MLFGLVGRAAGAAPAAARDRPRDARPHAARRSCRRVLAVAAGARSSRQMMPDSVRRAGFEGEGLELGEALFEAILARESGLVVHASTTTRRPGTASRTPTGRVTLSVPELLDELVTLARRARGSATPTSRSCCRPASAAPTPRTRSIAIPPGARPTRRARCGCTRATPSGSASPTADAPALTTKRGSVETVVEVTDTLQPGYVTLPNGLGTQLPGRRTAPRRSTASRPTS